MLLTFLVKTARAATTNDAFSYPHRRHVLEHLQRPLQVSRPARHLQHLGQVRPKVRLAKPFPGTPPTATTTATTLSNGLRRLAPFPNPLDA